MTSVTDKKSPEWDKIMKELERANGSYVTVGIHSDAGEYTEGEHPPKVVEVALWNEFGTDKIPARSFFRSAIDEGKAKIESWREQAINKILIGGTAEEALDLMGFKIQTLIQNKIKSNVPPPNKLSTTRSKMRAGVLPKRKTVKEVKARLGFLQAVKKRTLSGADAAKSMQASGKTGTLIHTKLMLRSVTFKKVMG